MLSVNDAPYTKVLPFFPGVDETPTEKIFVKLIKNRLGNNVKGDVFWLPVAGAMKARADGAVAFLGPEADNTLSPEELKKVLAERNKAKGTKAQAVAPGKDAVATK